MSDLARELWMSVESLRQWLRHRQIDQGKREGLTMGEEKQLERLRAELGSTLVVGPSGADVK
ncbi:MAG: hypothetical protein ACOY3F_08010 [Bacillota bacterium]